MIKDKCPKLKKMIWDDPKGMRDYDDPILISLKEVMKLGEDWTERTRSFRRPDQERKRG